MVSGISAAMRCVGSGDEMLLWIPSTSNPIPKIEGNFINTTVAQRARIRISTYERCEPV
jgi:hypothetical protein